MASRLFLLIFSITMARARILTLNSSDDYLISDGVHQVEKQEQIQNACDHQYGFLPCAENSAGYIFQILVYQGLLIYGEKQLSSGSKVLLHILGVENYGGIIFRILMALPSMMLMIISGVFGSKENAQSQVSLGVGIYAGMTVFSLTLQWGVCVIFGKTDLLGKSKKHIEASSSNCSSAKEKLIILRDTGVLIDRQTRDTAGIMLLSLIPYAVVQLFDISNTASGNRVLTLITLIVSSLSLITYFIYQIFNPWIQKISLDYSKYEVLRTGFLQHVQRQGQLVNEEGKLNTNVIKKLFDETDRDADKCITKGELQNLAVDIINNGKVKVDEKYAVKEVMKKFDFDSNRSITQEEFIKGCEKWIQETNQSSENSHPHSGHIFQELMQLFKERKEYDPKEIDKIMSKILKHAEKELLKSKSLITQGKPDTENIKNLFKQFDTNKDGSISKSELEELIRNVKFGEFQLTHEDIVKELFKDFDEDSNDIIDEPEFLAGVNKWLEKAIRVANTSDRTRSIDEFDKIVWREAVYDKWTFMKSLFQVSLGIFVLTFLGGPLTVSILQLSYAMGLQSFSISFVIVPVAMNARALMAAIFPASQKSQRTASLTFSEIYSGVIMNNISGLTTLLAIVYAKELTWDFSAEVLTILVVCAVIGILAYSCNTYPLWTCILAFFLYPFSLGFFYFVQVFFNWK
ncbi:Ca2+ sensor (EF-Hand superfamily) [Handroanthus impetiginosus]|uniref:Ca2+ sensor (EF-Hand superfamily) n=1 Tax=Handroanthus impetiginosus TaxID=429701 RepID=A0A2G9I0L3_9LAMI|nr:Ca2+ sensor (EF-Hand superfamily) [Handroanthus impetiginosus]